MSPTIKILTSFLVGALLTWSLCRRSQSEDHLELGLTEKAQSASAMHYIISATLYYQRDHGGNLPKNISDLFPSVIEMPKKVVPEFMRRNLGLSETDHEVTPELIDALGIWQIVRLDRENKRFCVVGLSQSLTDLSFRKQLIPVSIWNNNDFDDRFLTQAELLNLLHWNNSTNQ